MLLLSVCTIFDLYILESMKNKVLSKENGVIAKVVKWAVDLWKYCSHGVWADTRTNLFVRIIKTVNLSVSSFLNTDLQSRAAALTYRTVLAIVPALAMVFAIARGFGFQNLLQSRLFGYFPQQSELLKTAFSFVDSYLSQASEGLFVGIGIVFLMWTLISLLGGVEDSFNVVWGIKKSRSIWRKMTDYTAIFLILPVLFICSTGLSIFMSETLQNAITFRFLSPIFPVLLDIASVVLTWLFFAGMYMLIPNTKVKFSNAMVAGFVSGTAFLVVQWLFVSGQLYVSKYNAIYGSFSFLPLMLLWLYFVWIICLSGAVLCYSSQNIFRFSYFNDIKDISPAYRRKMTVALMGVVARQMYEQRRALTQEDLSQKYGIPIRLVTEIVNELVEAGLVSRVLLDEKREILGLQPAVDVHQLTLGMMIRRLDQYGASGFVDEFDNRFPDVFKVEEGVTEQMCRTADEVKLIDLKLKLEE